MYTCICKECGKVKKVRYRSEKSPFCSNKCAAEYRYKGQRKKCICKTCGKEFYLCQKGKQGKGLYCSNKCCTEDHRTGHWTHCLQCGEPIWTTPSRNRMFCSKRCASLHMWAERKRKEAANDQDCEM